MLDEESVIRLTLAVWERFDKLRERVKKRREHFHRDEGARPTFDKESGIENDFQTHLLKTTWRDMKARLTENHFRLASEPLKKSEGGKTKAELLEKILNTGFDHMEVRKGYTIQSALSDGQIVEAFRLLHWHRADEVYPPVPEWEYMDELPDPDEEGLEDDERKDRREKRGRYEENDDGDQRHEGKGKYRETGRAYVERVKEQRAKAGFPYGLEDFGPLDSAFIPDKAGGMAVVVTMQKIPLVKYREEQAGQKYDGKPIQIALSQREKKIRVYREQGAPPSDQDPTLQYTEHVTVACLWTRDEWHEIAVLGDVPVETGVEAWEYIKGGNHQWGEPPFALVTASEYTPEAKPEKRYLPALDDMFDMKGEADKFVALFLALGEKVVIKDVFLENVKGVPGLNEDGTPVELGPAGSISAQGLPAGHALKTLEHDINPGFVQGLELILQHLRDAAPDTGKFEIESDSQPWTARLGLQMANVYPKQLMTSQMQGIEKAAISIAQDMSQRDQRVWVHQKGEDIIAIDPKNIPGLKITAHVVSTSAAERVVEEEHGRELLNDPNFPLTPEECLEMYFNEENPHERVVRWKAYQMFTTLVEPGLMQAEAAKRYGWKAYLTPGMGFVGTDGQPRTSQQIVEGSDQYSSLLGGNSVGSQVAPQSNMPDLSDASRPPTVTPQASLSG